jgi:hypothetical protein
MSLRRQAYEWRNIVPGNTSSVSNTGHPILTYDAAGAVQGRAIQLNADQSIDIMVGDIGNNLEMPAELRAHQFIIIDSIGCWPYQAAINIRIGTTRYFQNPDGVPDRGMPASAMPFQPITVTSGQQNLGYYESLVPPVYVLPGQPWGIEFTPWTTLNAGSPAPTTDNDIARAYVRYLLIDGPDQLIAMKLLKANIPVSADNIQWYKQQLIRSKLEEDMGIKTTLEETLGDSPRRLI